MLSSILELVLSDTGLTAIGTGIAVLITVFAKSAKALKAVRIAAELAYDAVNALKDQTPTKIDDKAAIALRVIVDRLGRELTPKEVAAARATFDARHAQEQVAKALAAKIAAGGK